MSITKRFNWRPAAAWVLRILIVSVALSAVFVYFFPLEAAFGRAAILNRRDGCSLGEALAGVFPAAQIRKHTIALKELSRIVRNDDAAGLTLWHTPAGDYWAPEGDESLFFVIAELEHEPYEAGAIRISSGAVVLDCGAHLGVFTRQALAAGASLVVAIEPGRKQLECLSRTFAPEIASGRVIIEPKGVWDTEGQLELAGNADTAVSSFVFGSGGRSVAKVPVTTIDDIVSELKLRKIDLIKMDIEGAELNAISGAKSTLSSLKPKLAIAAYHRPSDHLRIPELVLSANPSYRKSEHGCRLDLSTSVPLTAMFQ